ncbi:MAG: type III pantothenate kinase [Planctomycetaceae bacterium]|nr:type III pantothenate kinase [Planctomycetaceae bacterium]
MNLIAIEIGNSNIKTAFYRDDDEVLLRSLDGLSREFESDMAALLNECWDLVPLVKSAAQPVKDCQLVASSVKPEWTELVSDIVKDELGQKLLVIGQDIPLPIETSVDNPLQVGTDRLITAAAAYAVVEQAVVIADFGTAVTIDLVDDEGVFVGGTISPGFDLSLRALKAGTARLPEITMQKPKQVYGVNTEEAMRAGVYWAAVGLLETVCRKYAEQIGHWPQVILTGGAAALIKDDCDFVDSYVPNLAVHGIMIAFKKNLYESQDIERLDEEDHRD